ncbi:MAG: peptide deformylase [Patescibacteria group bacterium]
MPVLPILTHPNETLRRRAKEISPEELPKLQKFFDDLEKTMLTRDGVGLAATQVNVTWRAFAMATQDGPVTYINPSIHRKSFRKKVAEEGCLSIPGVYGDVKRHWSVTLKALDRSGKPVTLKVEGLFARVVQHEVDHLDGILFTDRTKKITRLGDRYTHDQL